MRSYLQDLIPVLPLQSSIIIPCLFNLIMYFNISKEYLINNLNILKVSRNW
jgi:hypothetical protein